MTFEDPFYLTGEGIVHDFSRIIQHTIDYPHSRVKYQRMCWHEDNYLVFSSSFSSKLKKTMSDEFHAVYGNSDPACYVFQYEDLIASDWQIIEMEND